MTLPPDPPSDPAADPGEVTRLLHLARDGDREALDRLVPLVYEDLRRMAHRQLDREGGGHTLQTTGLLHEAYLKLAGSGAANAANRAHFLAIAARAMRQVLVDYARRRKAAKRGGGIIYATLGDAAEPVDASVEDLLSLNEALEQLEPRQRQVIECRFFGEWRRPISRRRSGSLSGRCGGTGSRRGRGCSGRCRGRSAGVRTADDTGCAEGLRGVVWNQR